MTNYEVTPKNMDATKIIAILSNLFIAGLGFIFYGDIKRFLKYAIIEFLLCWTVIVPIIMVIMAMIKIYNEE